MDLTVSKISISSLIYLFTSSERLSPAGSHGARYSNKPRTLHTSYYPAKIRKCNGHLQEEINCSTYCITLYFKDTSEINCKMIPQNIQNNI